MARDEVLSYAIGEKDTEIDQKAQSASKRRVGW
jgi:hypothetical protein